MKIETEFDLNDLVYGLVVNHIPIPSEVGCAFCGQTGKIKGKNKAVIDCPQCKTYRFMSDNKPKIVFSISKKMRICGIRINELNEIEKTLEKKEFSISYVFESIKKGKNLFENFLNCDNLYLFYQTPVFKNKQDALAEVAKRNKEE